MHTIHAAEAYIAKMYMFCNEVLFLMLISIMTVYHIYVHECLPPLPCTSSHAHTHIHNIYVYTHAPPHVCIHSHISSYMHTYVRIYTVNKSQVANPRPQTPTALVYLSSSCPYAESQPGQLLAVFECSNSVDPTGVSPNASILAIFKYERLQIGTRTILVPSSDADILLQRDQNSPSYFYLLLEHVNFVLPENSQDLPTYEAYVQCTNGVSTATRPYPVTFCIKHSMLQLTTLTEFNELPYSPATLYFTNIPREFHIFTSPRPAATHGHLLFNVRVGAWNANVPSYRIPTENRVVMLDRESHLLRFSDVKCQISDPPLFAPPTGECV